MHGNMICRYGRAIQSIPVDGIVFMEKSMRKIRVHTKDGIVEFYGKFSDIAEYLDERFMCCHRSYIINMDEIVLMNCRKIFVSSNDCIDLGRDTYSRARKAYGSYLSAAGKRKRSETP